jgi:4-hydroxy-tetrahydrodipicolinate synthase
MAMGGHGLISVASNLFPKPLNDLVQACLNRDFEQGRSLHATLSPFFKAAFIETNPAPIKAAMEMCGLAAGPCRLPLCDLMPESRNKLRDIVECLPTEWMR